MNLSDPLFDFLPDLLNWSSSIILRIELEPIFRISKSLKSL